MNQRPHGLKVKKAITGFLHYKNAEGLAPVTVSCYERDLNYWIEYQGDMDVYKVQSSDVISFLNYLRTAYVPRRIMGDNSKSWHPRRFTTSVSAWLLFSPGPVVNLNLTIR